MKIREVCLVLGSCLLLGSTSALAIDDFGRWYGSLMISGIDEARDRGLETEWSGYHVGFGRGLGSDWGVELNVVGTRFENRAGDVAVKQWGIGADVTRRIVETARFSPYIVAGGGYMTTDHKLGRKDRDGGMLSVGAGLLVPVDRLRLALRTELRARRDFSEGALTDYLLSIGVQIPFSFVNLGQPARAPLPDGRPHPESAAQPYGIVVDSDGDGVPDIKDLCPGTPPGALVNVHGCAPEDDSDGDGVPDSRDMCPDTPLGVPVDHHGCRIVLPPGLDAGRSD